MMSQKNSQSNKNINTTNIYFLIGVWLLSCIISVIILPPVADDYFYFVRGLGFANYGNIGVLVGEEYLLSFLNVPGHSIMQGTFLFFWDLIGLPINYFTYRIFHILLILLLLLATLYLFTKMNPHTPQLNKFTGSLFLALIALTPFTQYCWALHPVILGILLIVLGLLPLAGKDTLEKVSSPRYFCSAFFIGCAATVHANISLRAGILVVAVMVISAIRKRWKRSLLYGFTASIPLVLSLIWFLAFMPESLDEFFTNIGTKKVSFSLETIPLYVFLQNAFFSGPWNSVFIRGFYTILWLPLLLCMIATCYQLLKHRENLLQRSDTFVLLTILFIIELIRLFIPEGDKSLVYFTMTSFFTLILLLPLFFNNSTEDKSPLLSFPIISKGIILFIMTSSILFHPAVHSVKFLFSSTNYFSPIRMSQAVRNHLNQDDTFFVSAKQALPVFSDLIAARYANKENIEIYSVFPAFRHPAKNKINIQNLERKLRNVIPSKSVWGFAKHNFQCSGGKANVTFTTHTDDSVQVNFQGLRVIYEDKDFIFIRPETLNYTIE